MEVKKIKRKYLYITFIFFLCITKSITSYGKYVFDKTIDIAQLDLDRQKPIIMCEKIQFEDISAVENSKTKQIKESTQNAIMFINFEEKNINNDMIDMSKIEIYINNQKSDLKLQIDEPKENTANKGKYSFIIKVIGIPKGKKVELKIKKGALTDIAGWKNDEYVKTIQENLL